MKSPDVAQHLTGEKVEDQVCEGYNYAQNTGHTDQPLFHFGKSAEQGNATDPVWLTLSKPPLTSPKGNGENKADGQPG